MTEVPATIEEVQEEPIQPNFPPGYGLLKSLHPHYGGYHLVYEETPEHLVFLDWPWSHDGKEPGMHTRYLSLPQAEGAAWKHYNNRLVEQENETASPPWSKVLGWVLDGDTWYHAECVQFFVTPDRRDVITYETDNSVNMICQECSEPFVSDALRHLMDPENCECDACMRTSLAATDDENGRSNTYLEGFRVGASSAFEECRSEGLINDDISIEQYAKAAYQNSKNFLEGYRDAEAGKYPYSEYDDEEEEEKSDEDEDNIAGAYDRLIQKGIDELDEEES